MCIYMHRDVLKSCVSSSFQERTQDYRSQVEAGATPHTCNVPEIHTCPSLSFPSHPLPNPQHAFACKEKYFELFIPLTNAKPDELEALLSHRGIFKF